MRVNVLAIKVIPARFRLFQRAHLHECLQSLGLLKDHCFEDVSVLVEDAEQDFGSDWVLVVGNGDEENWGRLVVGSKLVVLYFGSGRWVDLHRFVSDQDLRLLRRFQALAWAGERVSGALEVLEFYEGVVFLNEDQDLFYLAESGHCGNELIL